MSTLAVGIDLGGTSIKAALVRRGHGVLHERSRATEADHGPSHVVDRIALLIQELITEAGRERVAGIGIGAPGVINWARTTISHPPNFPGWDVVDMPAELARRIGQAFPVIVENDANVAGLGTAHYGAGRPHDSFIMVTLGTGVGGAIIYQNAIFRGATGGAGEIGHMTIDYEGPVAKSGVAGAIEAYLGQRFLTRHARYRLLNHSDSSLYELAGPDLGGLTPKLLHDAALAGDEPAQEVLAWAGHKLGCVLGSAINLLDIRKVIVGGGISAAGDFIFEPARRTILRYVAPGLRSDVEIIRETLGNEVGMLGAAHLVFQALDADVAIGTA